MSQSLEEKIKLLNERSDNFLEENLEPLLNDTYSLQRGFLNNVNDPPSVREIKEKWPILFNRQVIIWHYEKLMQHKLQILEDALKKKCEKIIKFGIQKKLTNLLEINYPYEVSPDGCIEALKIIAKYFKEHLDVLITSVAVSKHLFCFV